MDGIYLKKENNYATLCIDTPQNRNALSVPVLQEIDTLINEVIADSNIHCLLITGGGEKSFIAGADISRLAKMTPEDSRSSVEFGHRLFTKIETLDIPVVAAINGYCLGGGLELALCCDIRICSANAKFGLPEINIGMLPAWGGTLRLPRLIGESRAKNMMMRGLMITADQALSYGLVADVYEDVAAMRKHAEMLAAELAAKAPIAMKIDKRLVYDAANKQPTDIAQRDSLALGFVHTTHDTIEGLTAFLEKRPPKYEGR